MQRNFSSPEMLARPSDDFNLLENLRGDLRNRQAAVSLGLADSVMELEAGNIDLPLTPTQADLIDAGLAAGKTLEDIVMDDINGGGDDNLAQFSTDV